MLTEGRVAGAGLDVYAQEPCTDSPLFQFDQVVCTPHLGASTDEAQEKAGVAVTSSVRLALAGELLPDAVNVQVLAKIGARADPGRDPRLRSGTDPAQKPRLPQEAARHCGRPLLATAV